MKKILPTLSLLLVIITTNCYSKDKPSELTIAQWITGQFFTKVSDSNLDIFFKKDHTYLIYKATIKQPNTYTKFKFKFSSPKLEMTPVYKGTWTTNEIAKELTITNSQGQSFVFNFIPPNDDLVCMLIKGSFNNANVNESWVSVIDLTDDDPGYQGP